MIHMNRSRFTPFLALTIILCLALAGCPASTPVTPDQALTALEAAVASAEVVVVALGATGVIPVDVAAEITAAMLPLPGIFRQTAQEMASTDTDIVKSLKIAEYFQPEIQALTILPAQAQVWTGAVMSAIKVFLSFYVVPQGMTLVTAPRGGHVTTFDPTHLSTVALKIGAFDQHVKAIKGR
jgi:hypothetical protein